MQLRNGIRPPAFHKAILSNRNRADEALLLAAQTLSLVYSFDGENVSEDELAELSPLAALVGKSAQEMFQALRRVRATWVGAAPKPLAGDSSSRNCQQVSINGPSGTFRRMQLRAFSFVLIASAFPLRSFSSEDFRLPKSAIRKPNRLSTNGSGPTGY